MSKTEIFVHTTYLCFHLPDTLFRLASLAKRGHPVMDTHKRTLLSVNTQTLANERTQHTKSVVVVTPIAIVVVAIRRTQVVRFVVPRTAAQHTRDSD